MTKINKTMQALLDRAQTNHRGIGVVQVTWGRGPQGGQTRHGYRESDALHKLVEFGLVEIVETYTSTIPNSGHTTWVCDKTYRIIPAMPTDDDYMAALGPCNK